MTASSNFEAIGDRLPPQNVEAEEAILGGILLDPEAIGRVLDLLRPEMFYVAAHQEVYRACVTLHNQSKPTDLTSVTTWLSDRGQLEKIGGQSKIVQLCDRTVSAVNIDYYAQLVADKYVRRKLLDAARQAIELTYDTGLELPQTLDLVEQKIFAVTQSRAESGLIPASDILTSIFFELDNRYNNQSQLDEDGVTGLATGFYDLDAMTQGLQRSDLIVIAGRPSMGKTAFGLELARRVAEKHRLPVAIYSLEMSKEQLVYRLLASQTKTRLTDPGIDSSRLRSGQLDEHEWSIVANAIGALSELPIYIDDTASPSVNELRSKARKLQAEKGGLGLILIDYLQLMEGSGSDNRVQELSRITRSLKGLARELHVPTIALSQLSRGVEARTNKRPLLSDLRESGSIEQDADLVINLYRDEYYNPDTPDRGVAEVIVAKHRNGPVGTVKLLFEPRLTKFENMAERR